MQTSPPSTPTSRDYSFAARHEAELTPNQRRVLDLLVAGRTNGEIGEALGMTLDGAKWNVSEILGKLGFASREEAAEYWRWRQHPVRRLSRAVRGFVALPVAKWVGGAAAVSAAVAGAWLVIAAVRNDEAGPAIPPFYLEATVTVTDSSETTGTNRTDAPEVTESRLRWWHRDRDHSRWEIDTVKPAIEAKTVILVADGNNQWVYDSLANTYSQVPLPPLPKAIPVRPVAMSLMVGPALAGTVAELVASLTARDKDSFASVTGKDTVLGRNTVIVEYGPVARSSGSDGVERAEGVAHMWVDPVRMMVLRVKMDSETQSIFAEVTRLDSDTTIARERLAFVPPAGAREVQQGGVSSSSGGGSAIPAGGSSSSSGSGSVTFGGGAGGAADVQPPRGFFRPTYVPVGYSVQESGSENRDGTVAAVHFSLRETGGAPAGFVRIDERLRPGGLPDSLRTGDRLTVSGNEAYRTTEGSVTSLVWADGDVVLALTTNALPFDELLRVAQSMEEVP